jgi:capsular polysaccharide biosynthesis protein
VSNNVSPSEYEPWALITARAARRYAMLIVIFVIAAAAVGAGVTAAQPTTYTSRTSLVLQTAAGPTDSETMIRTVQALVKTDAVGEQVASAAGLNLTPQQVTSKISVERPPGSGLIDVIVTDTNRARGQAIAGKLPGVFQAQIVKLNEPSTTSTLGVVKSPAYSVTPWAGGAVFTTQDQRPYVINGLIGAALGLVLVLIFLAVRRQLLVLRPPVATNEVYLQPFPAAAGH